MLSYIIILNVFLIIKIKIDLFGNHEAGTFYPHHFMIQNGYLLRLWLWGDTQRQWPVQPLFMATLMYRDKRIFAINARGINSFPPMLDVIGAISYGTCMAKGIACSLEESKLISR